jgi:hypothetical protein
MADFLDSAFLIKYQKETPAECNTLMNIKQKMVATAYEEGVKNLQVGEVEAKLVDNVTNFYLVADKPVTITLSNGITMENMTQFAYAGEDRISAEVSNNTAYPVKVTYAGGLKYQQV